MSLSIEDILATATPPETVVTLFLRGDLAAEYDRLVQRLDGASRVAVSLDEPSEAAVLVEEISALREQMAASRVEFRLRAMPALSWSSLYAKAPEKPEPTADEEGAVTEPSPQVMEQFEKDWHSWVCTMVAASVAEPKMTAKQAGQLAAKLSNSQWDKLANLALAVNTGDQKIPFFDAASAILPPTGRR